MLQSLLFYTAIAVITIQTVGALNCYRCHSSQAGCGKELNIRLQRWHYCPQPADGAGENFCVKIINREGAYESITRECLHTLREHTDHREKMPTVRRHGYCMHGRNDDPRHREDDKLTYCFCNDWNGCNTASGLKAGVMGTLAMVSIVALVMRLLV